jgi:hypothetical protein
MADVAFHLYEQSMEDNGALTVDSLTYLNSTASYFTWHFLLSSSQRGGAVSWTSSLFGPSHKLSISQRLDTVGCVESTANWKLMQRVLMALSGIKFSLQFPHISRVVFSLALKINIYRRNSVGFLYCSLHVPRQFLVFFLLFLSEYCIIFSIYYPYFNYSRQAFFFISLLLFIVNLFHL